MADTKGQNERGAVQPRHETRSGTDLGGLERGGGMDVSTTPQGHKPLKAGGQGAKDENRPEGETFQQVQRHLDTTEK